MWDCNSQERNCLNCKPAETHFEKACASFFQVIRTDHSNGGHLTDDQVTNKTLKRVARKNLVHRVIYLDLPSVVTVNVWLVNACPAFVNCTPAARKAALAFVRGLGGEK